MNINLDNILYWLQLTGHNPRKIGDGSIVEFFVHGLSFLIDCDNDYVRIRLSMSGCRWSPEDVQAAANYAMNRQRGIKIYMQDDLVLFSIEQYVSSWDYFRDNFNRYIMTFFSAAQDFTSYHNL